MQRKLRSKPLPHLIIPDTSVLWCADKKPTVNPEFDEFWITHHQLLTLQLMIPDVVRGELLFQQVTSAERQFEKLSAMLLDLSATSGAVHKIRTTADRVKEQVVSKFDVWLKQKRGKIIGLPLDLDWAGIVESSIWRRPPFSFDPKNTDNEKGFRDAVILETVCRFVQQEKRNVAILFLCSDTLLLNSARARLASYPTFSCFESLPSVSSYIKLTHEQHAKEFSTAIIEKARTKFFLLNDEDTIWNRDRIAQQIRSRYNREFKLTDAEAALWETSDAGTWFIDNAEFVSHDADGTYHWSNAVTFVQLYGYRRDVFQTTIQKLDDKQSVEYALAKIAEFFGKVSSKLREVLQIKFRVLWSSKLSNDGRFLDTRIGDIQFQRRALETINAELQHRFKLP